MAQFIYPVSVHKNRVTLFLVDRESKPTVGCSQIDCNSSEERFLGSTEEILFETCLTNQRHEIKRKKCSLMKVEEKRREEKRREEKRREEKRREEKRREEKRREEKRREKQTEY